MARPVLKGDETFAVYNKPRAWLGVACFGLMAILVVLVMIVAIGSVAPGELLDWPVLLIMGLFTALGGLLFWWAYRLRSARYLVLSADALGVWVGRWGRRQGWRDLDTIRLRAAPGDIVNNQRFLAFEGHAHLNTLAGPLGRLIGAKLRVRMIDLWGVQMDKAEVIDGLHAAAKAGGYTLIEERGHGRWKVKPLDDDQGLAD